MKFYTSIGPNPRVVKMFMAEKGIDIHRVEVDLLAGENRGSAYRAKNPSGTTPALEFEDGGILAEITAICEYLEEIHPAPPLIGASPRERAETRMWVRRIDLGVVEPMANGFRFSQGLALFKDRMRCLPEAAEGLKAIAQDKLAWLHRQMGERRWIVGERFSLADILLFCFVDFGTSVGQPLDAENRWIAGWFERVKARPSALASA